MTTPKNLTHLSRHRAEREGDNRLYDNAGFLEELDAWTKEKMSEGYEGFILVAVKRPGSTNADGTVYDDRLATSFLCKDVRTHEAVYALEVTKHHWLED